MCVYNKENEVLLCRVPSAELPMLAIFPTFANVLPKIVASWDQGSILKPGVLIQVFLRMDQWMA